MSGFIRIQILFSALVFSLCARADPEDFTYTVGVVPQFEQRKLYRIWQPVIKALEARTGFRLKMMGSPKIPAFEKHFLAGEYDFAYMNPYHVLKANQHQGYLPLVRDGSRRLRGVLVVPKDSPLQSVQELNGRLLAFPAPNALGASLLMRSDLGRVHGISFVPRYVQTHSSVYLNVLLGQVAAGGGVRSTLEAQPDKIKSRLRVLYQTRTVAPHPFVAHPRVPESHQRRMRQALLSLARTDEGQALLSQIPMHQAIPASMNDYASMNELGLEKYYVPE